MKIFTINVSAVNIYSEPRFTSSVVSQGLLGESCEMLDRENQWYLIKQNDGYEGWVYHFFGTESDELYPATHVCTSMFAPIFDKQNGKVIRDVCFGNKLKVSTDDDGKNVILPDGRKGWTEADLRNEHPTPTRKNIIHTAKRFIGTPYQWGGKSPGGMDCSGLVQTVFQSVGIQLPRDAYQQAELFAKKRISIDHVNKGDLLFFAEDNKINHVAISLGGQEFLHAQGWVKEESLDSDSSVFNSKLDKILLSVHSMEDLLL